jgi:hypothetical protein
MELAGLEPATSWVRSQRSLARNMAWLGGFSCLWVPRIPFTVFLGFGASILCVHRLFHARARIPDCSQFDKGAWARGRAASLESR